jgi:coenzyme F420-0:L-glutamate ligase/coenzyme F420-1:gamma-L-glutamate ligase
MERLVTDEVDTPGARTLPRTGPTDMFRLGADEAYAEGFAAAVSIHAARESTGGAAHPLVDSPAERANGDQDPQASA